METKEIKPEVMPMERQEVAMAITMKHHPRTVKFYMSLEDRTMLKAYGMVVTDMLELSEYRRHNLDVIIFITDSSITDAKTLEFYIYSNSGLE